MLDTKYRFADKHFIEIKSVSCAVVSPRLIKIEHLTIGHVCTLLSLFFPFVVVLHTYTGNIP